MPKSPGASAALDEDAIAASIRNQDEIRAWIVKFLTHLVDGDTATSEPAASRPPRADSKQDRLIELLRRPEGATIAQMVDATGWAPHTCRGVMAGALKKRLGLTVTSTKIAGEQRVYRLPS